MKQKREQKQSVDFQGELLKPFDVVIMSATSSWGGRGAGLQFGVVANGTPSGAQVFSLSELQRALKKSKIVNSSQNLWKSYVEALLIKPTHRPTHALYQSPNVPICSITQDVLNMGINAVKNYLYEKEEA